MKMVFKSVMKRVSLILLGLPIVAAIYFPILGSSDFWSGDDEMNLLIYSGGYTGDTEWKSHIQSPIFGFLVSTFYDLSNAVPWYEIFVLAMPLVASLLFLLDINRTLTFSVYLQVLIPISFGMLLLGARVNYTFASFITCAVGVCWLVLRVKSEVLSRARVIAPLVVCTMGIALRTFWPNPIVLPPTFVLASVMGLILMGFPTLRIRKVQAFYFFSVLASAYLINLIPQIFVLGFDSDWAYYVNFYSEIGFTWSRKFAHYLQNTNFQVIEKTTGIDSFGINQARQSLYLDAESLPTDGLRRLGAESLGRFKRDAGLFGQANLVWQDIARFFRWSVVVLFVVAAAVQIQDKSRLIGTYLYLLVLVSIPAILLGLTTYTYVLSDYVLAGVSFTLYLSIVMTSALESIEQESATPKNFVESIPLLVLIVVGSYLSLGREAILSSDLSSDKSKEIINESSISALRETSNFDYPVNGVRGRARPFNINYVDAYFESNDISTIGEARSPYFVKRWNMITGDSATKDTLFNTEIYEKMLLRAELAQQISESLFAAQGICLKPQHTIYRDFFLLKSKPGFNCGISVVDGDSVKPLSNVFSSDDGVFVNVLNEESLSLEIVVISPFGEYAKPHEAKVILFDSKSKSETTQIVRIIPGNESKVFFSDLSKGDRIHIYSESRCEVPAEVVPGSTDFRQLCVGIEKILINGNELPISQLISD